MSDAAVRLARELRPDRVQTPIRFGTVQSVNVTAWTATVRPSTASATDGSQDIVAVLAIPVPPAVGSLVRLDVYGGDVLVVGRVGPPPAWPTYAATLSATTTNPTLGTGGTVISKWLLTERKADVRVTIVFGSSGVAAGSGSYFVNLPIAAAAGAFRILGRGAFYDSSAVAYTQFDVRTTASASNVEFLYPATWPNGGVTGVSATTPAVPAANDQIEFSITYEY